MAAAATSPAATRAAGRGGRAAAGREAKGGGLRQLRAYNLVGGNPLLAPLGNYGGPTQTMALLPGSPAIGTGDPGQAGTADQRGYTRGGRVDIGAYQDQGFTLTPVNGSTPQATSVAYAFPDPLAVAVTADNTGPFVDPVDGGVITFTANAAANGASASLSPTTATITGGQASVTATANATAGSYKATASAAGVADPATFSLTNTPSLVVNTTQDLVTSTGGLTSLREAIANAESLTGPRTITSRPDGLPDRAWQHAAGDRAEPRRRRAGLDRRDHHDPGPGREPAHHRRRRRQRRVLDRLWCHRVDLGADHHRRPTPASTAAAAACTTTARSR